MFYEQHILPCFLYYVPYCKYYSTRICDSMTKYRWYNTLIKEKKVLFVGMHNSYS